MTIELSIFRFDYKSDYLPYYKKYFLKIKEQKSLLDLFKEIDIDEPFGFEKNEDFSLVVNGLYTKVSITIEELVKDFGKDLTIEPLSIRRANKDLIIDESDFQEKLELLNDYTNEDDKKEYLSNNLYFYASNTMNFQYKYIGDPILLLAHKLIEKNPENKASILKILENQEFGVGYHTNLTNRIYKFNESIEAKIIQVKKELQISKELSKQNFCIDEKSKVRFNSCDFNLEIKHDFSDFNLAYFYGNKKDDETVNLLNKLNAKQIKISSKDLDLNLESFHINPEFTLKIASSVMLEAFDSGADLLIVDNEYDFKLFDSNRKSLAQICGRDVLIPVLHKNELGNLAFAEHDKVKLELKKHSIDPEII